MKRLFQTVLLMLGFCACFQAAHAETSGAGQDDADALFNVVTRVEVGGVDISGEIPLRQISSLLNPPYTLSSADYQSATGEIHLTFKTAHAWAMFITGLEGLPESVQTTVIREFESNGTSPTWNALAQRDHGQWLIHSDVIGAWEISWETADSFPQSLRLDGVAITPELTLSAFAQRYPRSFNFRSEYSAPDAPGTHERTFYLTLAPMLQEELAYFDHLKFVFEGQTLMKVRLVRGIRY